MGSKGIVLNKIDEDLDVEIHFQIFKFTNFKLKKDETF